MQLSILLLILSPALYIANAWDRIDGTVFVLPIYLQSYRKTAGDIILVDCFDRMTVTVDIGHI